MKHYFKPYKNCSIFIETGTSVGSGVIAALNADFPIIHSIELSSHYYNLCKYIFRNQENVYLHLGNSLDVLPEVLDTIDQKCVFWLDAHWCGHGTAGSPNNVVLMEELKIINNHKIKEHTILIDDIRLITRKDKYPEWSSFPYTLEYIVNFIKSINPNYTISYEYGEEEQDILIAQIL